MPPGTGEPSGGAMHPETRPGAAETAVARAATPVPARRFAALQWLFVGFAVLNLVLLLNGSDVMPLRVMALAGYAAAVVLSMVALLGEPERGRRITIALHVPMAVLQF